MQVVTNQDFINRRARIGKLGTVLGLAAMGAGFVASFNLQYIAASYVFLIVGLFAFNFGRYNAIRWGTRPTVDEVLTNSLKGLDQKYVLVNYSSELPSSHVLLSPFGVFHIETRHNDGEIVCEGDKWRRKRGMLAWLRGFTEGQLGNPTKSTQAAIDRIYAWLSERMGADAARQVPVEGVVVFVHPRADLKVTNPIVPSVVPKDLKASVRTPLGRNKMSPDVYRHLQQIFVSENGRTKMPTKKAKV
ncbi:MAG: NERD domain-containing protein [Chloroflexi bacterium]|nr:NERD domain-containing protein [Chloroflexota bacterium]